jgi:peptidoglycan hydrolase CwlO-like protein
MPKPKQTPAQPPLFGDRDLVKNTLETERKILLIEIDSIEGKITKAQERAAELQERIDKVQESIGILDAMIKAAKK